MASKKQALRAARKLEPGLKKRKAFAVDVRKATARSGYAVYAYFAKTPRPKLQQSTTITDGEKRVRVPVQLVVTKPFRPE
jgi:hypothetical protein